jgi:hypothetical protein
VFARTTRGTQARIMQVGVKSTRLQRTRLFVKTYQFIVGTDIARYVEDVSEDVAYV